MSPRPRIPRILPFAALLLALTACSDRELPTAAGPGSVLAVQTAAAPVVNVADDASDLEGCTETHCTLREALEFAEAGATITFAAELVGPVAITGGTLSVEKNLTISGPGAATLTVSGTDNEGVFYVQDGVTAVISGLTITDAYYYPGIQNGGDLTLIDCVITGNDGGTSGHPGGLYNWGVLTITGSTVSNNVASSSYAGGGIRNSGGTLTITASTISGNTAASEGGGIRNESYSDGTTMWYGRVTVTNSTITNNSGLAGGGIYNANGAVSVVASTISGNTASVEGGGIYSDVEWGNAEAYTEIVNSTLSGNTAGFGGGVYNYEGSTRIILSTITANQAGEGAGVWSYNDGITRTDVKGSVIWGNTVVAAPTTLAVAAGSRGRTKSVSSLVSVAIAGTFQDVYGYDVGNRYYSLGYNLIGAAGGTVDFALEFNATGDQTDVIEAMLGTLADNGGPTPTHALLPGSPAIDAGTCTDDEGATIGTDQRGTSRPLGSTCDIGAFESDGGALPAPNFSFDLSTLPARTYGDASFSVASYANSTNSSGTISFSPAAGSVGCTVDAAGLVTPTGAATGTSECIVRAYLSSDGTYASATLMQGFNIARAPLTVTADDGMSVYGGSTPGFSVQYGGFVGTDDASSLGGALAFTFEGIAPTSYGPSATPPLDAGTYSITPAGLTSADYDISFADGTFTIGKANGSVSISNIPSHAVVGGSFTPTYTVAGDAAASTASSTPSVCTVDAGVVNFLAQGSCTLVASVAEGTNHLPATGNAQNFAVHPPLSSSCTYTVNPKNGQRAVTVSWANASPGVTKVEVFAGRASTKLMLPMASGSWSTSVKTDPTYGLWGGSARRDAGTVLVTSGTACTLLP